MPTEVASSEYGMIIYHDEWNTVEFKWLPATKESGAVPAPEGPATFPTGWFTSRDRAYQWLAE